MPAKHRPPMPKLPPFALADERLGRKARPQYLFVFFFLFGVPLFLIHMHLLGLPFFWDEHGQFIPTALDLLRTGALVPHSTVPNVHPPGLELYLAALYKIFGFSIPLTRGAMMLVASCGLLFTFLLAIELSQGTKGAPGVSSTGIAAGLAVVLYAEHDGAVGHAGYGADALGAAPIR